MIPRHLFLNCVLSFGPGRSTRTVKPAARVRRPQNNNPPPSGRTMMTCGKHGWAALGVPCPDCKNGDAPRSCGKHGWAHLNKGCPDCAAGR